MHIYIYIYIHTYVHLVIASHFDEFIIYSRQNFTDIFRELAHTHIYVHTQNNSRKSKTAWHNFESQYLSLSNINFSLKIMKIEETDLLA